MPLPLSIAAYFVTAAVVGVAGARLRRWLVPVALVPFGLQLMYVAVAAADFDSQVVAVDWLPSLGIELGFRVDALTLLLTAIVAGVGLLIVIYSASYMTDPARRARFLAQLVFFSGAMAGVVAADDLYGLFVFWEATTVASYLLIGFGNERSAARSAALQALLVTTLGALAMLGGFVLLALEAGTTSISAIVTAPPSGATVTVALLLIFVGAFTKSAQFPFQFWLPGAMAAPTPASAYLHSATMVKAGIVLLLLLAPGFSDEPVWAVAVTGTGLITMVLGAIEAIRQHDLKLLLAHGTVSQLGFITALLGVGLTGVALAVLVAHAMFKAALFLVVGIIDTATGTRDIRHLSGLGRHSPGLALVAALAAASMAGLPPLAGFVTKEAAFDRLIGDASWVALAVIALASALTVTYTARFWWGAFGGADGPAEGTRRAHPGLLVPPALLTASSLALGVAPGPLGDAVESATGDAPKLLLWPGWKLALLVSALVIALGAALHLIEQRRPLRVLHRRVPSTEGVYDAAVRGVIRTADGATGLLQNGSLPVYLAVIVSSVLVVPGVIWLVTADVDPSWVLANGSAEVVLAAVAITAAVASARVQRRMAAALLLGAVGFAVAGIFVTFGAPDLALTQLLVETFTVALFAFVLAKLPRRFGPDPRSLSRRVRLAVAVLAGTVVTTAALAATTVAPDRSVAQFYVDNAVAAGGRNVVNVILTDFRALDTLGEITVLGAAAIGVGALVGTYRRRARSSGEGEV